MGERATTIQDVFEQSQTGLQSHGKLIQTLHKIYNKTEYDVFWSKFCHYVRYPMIVFKREPAVERVIDFVAKFVPTLSKKVLDDEDGEEDEDSVGDNQLLKDLFEFLLESFRAQEKAVRFRCCQLINKLLTNLGEDAQIDDNLYEQLYVCMLERLKDRCPVVRYHAVLAMSRLQDPSDKNCPVIKAYLFLLTSDPNSDVRRAVLVSIAPSTNTLRSIVDRTRDVKDTVRKTAYEILADKINIKALSIAKRLELCNDGLNDRADVVRKACAEKLLQAWLRTCNGNILTLLRSLDVEDSTDICSTVLKTIFTASTAAVNDIVTGFNLLNENLLIPEDELTSESAVYWQCVCKYLHSMGTDGDEYMEKVLPTCVDFCSYIQRYVDGLKTIDDAEMQLAREFIIEQLLLIASYMDTADSASRKAFESLLHNMLLADHVSNRLVKSLVQRICELRGQGEPMVAYFAETVSEIREPINADKVTEVGGADENVDEEQNQLDNELKNDPLTLLKCQTIISEMVQQLKVYAVSPTLQMLVESQIVPGIQNEDAEVRNISMLSLGLCCCLNNKDLVLTYIPLFMQASQIDVEMVRVTALKILFDLLLIYGLEAVDVSEASSTDSAASDDATDNGDARDDGSVTTEGSNSSGSGTASKLVAIICSFLDGESTELRTYAAEGLAKLLLSGRVVSSKILSRLILLWYNPLSADDTHLRNCLGTMFPLYALAGRANQEVVEDAFLPTLHTLLNAPSSSPLTEVTVNNVAELLVQLTNSTLIQKQNGEVSQDNPGHDNLSEKVCCQILSDPESENVLLWTRILNQMRVSPDNEVVLKDLRVLCYKMVKIVKNGKCLRNLKRFQAYIEDLAKKYITSDDDLTNIVIEPVVHDQGEVEEDPAETPKRRVRGLYSQNLTLGMDSEAELDLTGDLTSDDVGMDIDASALMSRSTSDAATRRHSRKNTMTEVTEQNEMFLVQEAADKNVTEAVNVEDAESVTETTDEVPETTDEVTKATDEVTKSTDEVTKATDEVTKATDEVTKATDEVTKATDEGVEMAVVDSERSPRSRSVGRRSAVQVNGDKGQKSPAKSVKSPAKSAESPAKSSKTQSSKTPAQSSKTPAKSAATSSKSPGKLTKSAEKKPQSPVTRKSMSQEKRQRSGDEDESPKRRKTSMSPARASVKSTAKKASKSPSETQILGRRSSKSAERPEEAAKKRKISSSPVKTSKRKSTDTDTDVVNKRQRSVDKGAGNKIGEKKATKASSPEKQKESPKQSSSKSVEKKVSKTAKQKSVTDVPSGQKATAGKTPRNTRTANGSGVPNTPQSNSPANVRRMPKKVVPNTPELKSPRIRLHRLSPESIAETPEKTSRAATSSSESSPEKSTESVTRSIRAASTRSTRATGPRTDTESRSPKEPVRTRGKTSVAITPVSSSPRMALTSRRPVEISLQKQAISRSAGRSRAESSEESTESVKKVTKTVEEEDDDEEVPLRRRARPSHRRVTVSSKSVNSSQRSTRRSATPSSVSSRSSASRRSASTGGSQSSETSSSTLVASRRSSSTTPGSATSVVTPSPARSRSASRRSASTGGSQSSEMSSSSPVSSPFPSLRATKSTSARRSATSTLRSITSPASGRSTASTASQRTSTSTSTLRSITLPSSGRSTSTLRSITSPASGRSTSTLRSITSPASGRSTSTLRSITSPASGRSTTSTLRSISSGTSGRSTTSAMSQRSAASRSGSTTSSKIPKANQSSGASTKSSTRNLGASATTVFMKSARLASTSTSSSRAKASETVKGGSVTRQTEKKPAQKGTESKVSEKRLARNKPRK